MKLNYYITTILLIFSVVSKINSQNNVSNIRTIDLAFLPGINKPANTSDPNSENILTECLLMVKIEKIDSVSEVYFLLGDSKKADKVSSIIGNVVNHDGNYTIEFNKKQSLFTNYTCSVKTEITVTDFSKVKLVTFYLIDKMGKKSQELYYNLN